ncbi:unnamed protein product, partial [Amoebophrya sp. A25]
GHDSQEQIQQLVEVAARGLLRLLALRSQEALLPYFRAVPWAQVSLTTNFCVLEELHRLFGPIVDEESDITATPPSTEKDAREEYEPKGNSVESSILQCLDLERLAQVATFCSSSSDELDETAVRTLLETAIPCQLLTLRLAEKFPELCRRAILSRTEEALRKHSEEGIEGGLFSR